MPRTSTHLAEVLNKHEGDLLKDWVSQQVSGLGRRANEQALKAESSEFLAAFKEAVQSSGTTNLQGEGWKAVRDILSSLSASRAREGYSPSETASFVFSLKRPLFTRLRS